MKKEFILKLFDKYKYKYPHYYKAGNIGVRRRYGKHILSIEIESTENYIDFKFRKNCDIFFDLVKDKKLKYLININNLKLLKENYVEKVLKFMYETDNLCEFGNYIDIIIYNEAEEKINLNKLSNIKKYLLLTFLCYDNNLLYVMEKTKNKYLIALLEKVDLSEIEDEQESSILKGNLNLVKKIIKEKWTEENIVDYLEKNNINKLLNLIDDEPTIYKYVKEEENRKIIFYKKIKNYIESILEEPTPKKEKILDRQLIILKEIINKQIKDNKTDYIQLMSINAKSFIVREIYRRINEFAAEEYIMLLSENINFSDLENIELVKEYVNLKKSLKGF